MQHGPRWPRTSVHSAVEEEELAAASALVGSHKASKKSNRRPVRDVRQVQPRGGCGGRVESMEVVQEVCGSAMVRGWAGVNGPGLVCYWDAVQWCTYQRRAVRREPRNGILCGCELCDPIMASRPPLPLSSCLLESKSDERLMNVRVGLEEGGRAEAGSIREPHAWRGKAKAQRSLALAHNARSQGSAPDAALPPRPRACPPPLESDTGSPGREGGRTDLDPPIPRRGRGGRGRRRIRGRRVRRGAPRRCGG